MDQLKTLREKAGVSQNALAKAIGKSHTFVWGVEAGRTALTSPETIAAWASALHLAPDAIYQAIGRTPHDLILALDDADPSTWDEVRRVIANHNSDRRGQ